jgi:hypothetical protein
MSNSEKKKAASIVWFGIPADNPERAKAFYSELFDWKINPVSEDFWYIDTGGADESPDGGLKKRERGLRLIFRILRTQAIYRRAQSGELGEVVAIGTGLWRTSACAGNGVPRCYAAGRLPIRTSR